MVGFTITKFTSLRESRQKWFKIHVASWFPESPANAHALSVMPWMHWCILYHSGLGEVWDFWESSIITWVYNEDKCKHHDDKKNVSVFDSVVDKNHCGEWDRKTEDNFVHGVAVFKVICPYIDAPSSSCIENCDYCGNYSDCTSKAYSFYNHFFLIDDDKTTGDVDVEHEPNVDIVGNGFFLSVAMIGPSLFFVRSSNQLASFSRRNCPRNIITK